MFLSSMLAESAIVGLLQIFRIQYRIKVRTNNVNILYVSISLVCLIDSKREDIFYFHSNIISNRLIYKKCLWTASIICCNSFKLLICKIITVRSNCFTRNQTQQPTSCWTIIARNTIWREFKKCITNRITVGVADFRAKR